MGWVSTQPPPHGTLHLQALKLVKEFRIGFIRKAHIYFDVGKRSFFVLEDNWLDAGATQREITPAEKAKHLTPEIIAECLAMAMGR